MNHEEPRGIVRAVYLLALGGALGLVGLILFLGRGALHAELAEPATKAAQILVWGPRALIGGGFLLAISGAALVGFDWLHRRT